jgi:tubulin alpha
MREIIAIGIGSFGIKTTDNLIQGIAEEHQLNTESNEVGSPVVENSYPDIFFDEFQSGKYKGRTLFLDADSMAIDTVRAGPGSANYGLDNYCCGKSSLGSLFVKGHYGEGAPLVDASMEKVRALLERCDAPQGFMVSYGLGGGAGSGMGSLFISKFAEHHPDILLSVQ